MPSNTLVQFGGRKPILAAKLLPDHMAQTAENVDLRQKNLQPMKSTTEVTDLGAVTPKTLWKLGAYANTGSDLVTNGGFPADTASWTAGASATLSSIAGGQSGNCLKILADGAADAYAHQGITTVVGTRYRLKFYVKQGDEDTWQVSIGTAAGGDQNEYLGGEATGSWVLHSVTFLATATTTYISLFQIQASGAGTYVLFDTVTCYALIPAFITFSNGLTASVVNSPIQESGDRFFYTGDTTPLQSDSALWSGTTRRLGVMPPAVAATAGMLGSAGTDVQDYVSYVWTMVTAWGEESAPSPATAIITVMTGEGVALSVMTTPSGSNNDYEFKRIYRIASGTAGAEYYWLADIAVSSTVYNDYDAVDSLNAVGTDTLQTEDWAMPPDDMRGLTQAHNGMVIGYYGKELYVSEVFIPYAYPDKFKIALDSDVTGVGAGKEFILAVSGNHPYIITGSHPEALLSAKVDIESRCTSQRGVVSCHLGVFYPSFDGLAHCDGDTVKIITKDWITGDQWATLETGDIIATWYDGKYYAFFEGTNDGMIIDIEKEELTTFALTGDVHTIRDIYHDPLNDIINILSFDNGTDSHISSFVTSATKLIYTWKSKKIVDPNKYNCVKIKGDFTVAGSYLQFKYYLDGALVQTKKIWIQDAAPTKENDGDWWFDSNDSYKAYFWDTSIASPAWVANTVIRQGGMFRLPSDPGASDKEFQLAGNINVDSVQLSTSPRELV